MEISTEGLAYWYFRLNGFLTTVNFLIHPETPRDSTTDVDILGVRFPHRLENLRRPMRDDALFTMTRTRIYIVLAEIKLGLCDLNGPWTTPATETMRKVLRAVGAFPVDDVGRSADRLYSDGTFSDRRFVISLCCVGARLNAQLRGRYPRVPQITWDHILDFIFGRFKDYSREKAQHSQWDENGHKLWERAEACTSTEEYRESVQVVAP